MALQDTLDQLKDFDVNDLDINNIGIWPTPIKAIVLVLLCIGVLTAGYFFYVTEKIELLESGGRQEANLREDFEDKQFQARNLDAFQKQREEMQATFGALLRQLPSDTEVPGLLDDITRTALANSLKIESIDLQPETKSEFYNELPINITVEGDYHKIGSFVSGVSNLPRIVTLHDFDIRPNGGPTELRMTIVAKTYRYLEEE